MKFYFSKKTTLICVVLALLCLRASYWQWNRYNQKLEYIDKLKSNLKLPKQDLSSILSNDQKTDIIHRKALIEGEFDFSQEMVIRNRQHNEERGAFVITPLKLKNSDQYILVNRGFLPFLLATKEKRKEYQTTKEFKCICLLKESNPRRFLSPKDEAKVGEKRIDSWLRVDLEEMQKQLPYKILPYYAEILSEDINATIDLSLVEKEMVKSSAGKEELFFLPSRRILNSTDFDHSTLPIPVFSTVIPPGRHLGYVYEWIIIGAAILLIGLLLQFRGKKFTY
ncbi:MAG: SURF1 family protein [Deltaproteobacteria bacterium]|nr:SURF1 family protein [Deltaproteobacteria bacterium]